MKTRFLTMSALLVGCLVFFTSCCEIEITAPDGEWDPIKLTKSNFSASPNGDTLRCRFKNYSSGWFTNVEVNGQYLDIHPSDSLFNPKSIKCEVLKAETRGKDICIIVGPNTTSSHRYIKVGIECGDAFSHISISQDCK